MRRRRRRDQGAAEPVGVLVELLERRALGADEAVAEHVVAVPPDALDGVVAHRDFEAAPGLAQRAGAVVDGVGLGGVGHEWSPSMVLVAHWIPRCPPAGRSARSPATVGPFARRRSGA